MTSYETGYLGSRLVIGYLVVLFVLELIRRAYIKYNKYRLVKMPKEEKKMPPVMYGLALLVYFFVGLFLLLNQ